MYSAAKQEKIITSKNDHKLYCHQLNRCPFPTAVITGREIAMTPIKMQESIRTLKIVPKPVLRKSVIH
jgi:hypothetical protein